MQGIVPIQTVSWTHEDGSITRAPVDLWVAALLEVLDDDLRDIWIRRLQEKISHVTREAIHQTPVIVPGRG